MRRYLTTVLFIFFTTGAGWAQQVTVSKTDVYYTIEQMLLANEINESGEPFAEALGYNLDDLDPVVLNSPDSISYTLGIENYEDSRYQLGTIVSRSGMGLHMMWAPVVMQMASMETDPAFDGMFTGGTANGYKEDDELMKTIMHFAELSHHPAPSNPWPQYAEFISGDPHLPQAVDAANFTHYFATLRWDRSKMDKTLNPGAMAQSMMKQYLWAQDMESAFHDSLDNGIDADGVISPDSANSPHLDPNNNVFYGGDGLDGFIGLVLTAEAINKAKFMTVKLAYDGSALGAIDLMNYDPANGIQYFPHKVAVTEAPVATGLPPQLSSMTVTDANSDLFDQFSILWATLHFTNMMDPNNTSDAAHLAYKAVFDGDPFPRSMSETGQPGPFDLMKGTAKVTFMNVKAMHYDAQNGTFIDQASLDNSGAAVLGTHISTVNAGYIIVGLKYFVQEFAGTGLEQPARDMVKAQADFIIASLKDSDGTYFNGFELGTGADAGTKDVTSQAAAARGLYAAYDVTGNANYLNAANEAYDMLISRFYVAPHMAFRTADASNNAVYSPFNFAVIAGALREAALVGNKTEAPAIYTRFFKKVANRMQLSEAAPTGETGGDSDGDGIPFVPEQADQLPPVFATEATMDLTVTALGDEPNVIREFALGQNYPNPFNPTTRISFSIAKAGQYKLTIYSATGQVVRRVFDRNLRSQQYNLTLSAGNLANGIYYYELKGQGFQQIRKFILLK